MRHLRKHTPVRVEWEDIQDFSNDDWNDDSLEADTASIVSIGWVAKEYRGGRVLTNAKDFSPDDGQYRSVVAIPAGCVTAVQVLEVAGEVWDVGEE